jgi:fluoroquinolone resistance protein
MESFLKMIDANELQARWTHSILEQTNQEISRFGKSKRALIQSPFGITSSRLMDYRGFTLVVPIQFSSFSDADFTNLNCEWAGCFTDCLVTGSLFVGGNFDGRFVGKKFDRCDFSKASLTNTALGDSVFSDVLFVDCNLSYTMARGATFFRCDFSQSNLKQVTMLKCTFKECVFQDTRFHYASFAGSSFKKCVLDRSSLQNALLDHVRFTDD